jgi:hypothetical protein
MSIWGVACILIYSIIATVLLSTISNEFFFDLLILIILTILGIESIKYQCRRKNLLATTSLLALIFIYVISGIFYIFAVDKNYAIDLKIIEHINNNNIHSTVIIISFSVLSFILGVFSLKGNKFNVFEFNKISKRKILNLKYYSFIILALSIISQLVLYENNKYDLFSPNREYITELGYAKFVFMSFWFVDSLIIFLGIYFYKLNINNDNINKNIIILYILIIAIFLIRFGGRGNYILYLYQIVGISFFSKHGYKAVISLSLLVVTLAVTYFGIKSEDLYYYFMNFFIWQAGRFPMVAISNVIPVEHVFINGETFLGDFFNSIYLSKYNIIFGIESYLSIVTRFISAPAENTYFISGYIAEINYNFGLIGIVIINFLFGFFIARIGMYGPKISIFKFLYINFLSSCILMTCFHGSFFASINILFTLGLPFVFLPIIFYKR